MKKLSVCMLMLVFVLTASTALAAQLPTKEEAHARIAQAIEKAKKETEFEKIQEPYSSALNGVDYYISRKVISCEDPQMPGVDEEMLAFEAKLLKMYDELERQSEYSTG